MFVWCDKNGLCSPPPPPPPQFWKTAAYYLLIYNQLEWLTQLATYSWLPKWHLLYCGIFIDSNNKPLMNFMHSDCCAFTSPKWSIFWYIVSAIWSGFCYLWYFRKCTHIEDSLQFVLWWILHETGAKCPTGQSSIASCTPETNFSAKCGKFYGLIILGVQV